MEWRKLTGIAASLAILGSAASASAMPALTVAQQRVMQIARAAQLSGEIAMADQRGAIVDEALGLADREDHRAHHRGARWLWASVTKQVTAVLIMQQVEAGTLSLDGTIRTYLPGFAGAGGDTVTVRQVLQHLSGMPNPDDTPPYAAGVPEFYRQTGALIGNTPRMAGFCSGKSKADTGTQFAYNNCDYLVLGAMLEHVTGKSFAALVAEKIAMPLGLASLKLAPDGAPRGSGAAIGYTTAARRYPAINVATFGAAGALTGTARDLIAFDRALLAGALLTPESRTVLWQGNPKLGYEALGAWSFPARLDGCDAPVALVERRGDVGGIQVRNIIAPLTGRSIAIFTNDDTVDFGEVWQARGLAYDVLSAAFCTPVKH